MYAMTDEAYAITAAAPGTWTSPRLLATQVAFQSYWVGGGLAGVLIGNLLPGPIDGLGFALCALFVTLTLDACRTRGQVPSLVLAGAAFAVAVVADAGRGAVHGTAGVRRAARRPVRPVAEGAVRCLRPAI